MFLHVTEEFHIVGGQRPGGSEKDPDDKSLHHSEITHSLSVSFKGDLVTARINLPEHRFLCKNDCIILYISDLEYKSYFALYSITYF